MLGAVTSDSTSPNLAAIRNELAQGWDVFVIDCRSIFATKRADLRLKFLNWWLSHCGAP